MRLGMLQKLQILADAAKYDASCVSSGGEKRRAGKGMGSVTGQSICHAFTPDGRCVSLLKILLTNFCIYDCVYCVSRRSSNVPRARFSVDEVVQLTLDLYRRNCIEGLFLSSGIARSADETMADLVRVAKVLRQHHGFRGYIHLKTIAAMRRSVQQHATALHAVLHRARFCSARGIPCPSSQMRHPTARRPHAWRCRGLMQISSRRSSAIARRIVLHCSIGCCGASSTANDNSSTISPISMSPERYAMPRR